MQLASVYLGEKQTSLVVFFHCRKMKYLSLYSTVQPLAAILALFDFGNEF